jgi:hypothetical protein
MDEHELTTLREQAAQGSRDALDQLVELAAERGDRDELPRSPVWSSDALVLPNKPPGDAGRA